MRQDPLLDLWSTDSDIQPTVRIRCLHLLSAEITGLLPQLASFYMEALDPDSLPQTQGASEASVYLCTW